MRDFSMWFTTGFEHIADLKGYDHILFLAALSGAYPVKEWKKLLILITAFTIGHSVTLALSAMNLLVISGAWIEFLIPVTIVCTCLYNLVNLNKNNGSRIGLNYLMALFFGLIHGMGFSYLLKSLLGREANIAGPLFSFNLGLEAGQILVVSIILLISLILVRLFRVPFQQWKFFLSSAVFGISFLMALERIP